MCKMYFLSHWKSQESNWSTATQAHSCASLNQWNCFFSCFFFFFFQWNYTKNPIQLKSSTCAVRLRVCVVTYHSFPRQHTPTWTIHPGVRTNKKDKITENRAWFGHSNRHNVQYERRIMCASFCFIEIKRIEFTERRRERGWTIASFRSSMQYCATQCYSI